MLLAQHAVLIWDFDDTLVPLHSFSTGAFAARGGAAGAQAPGLVKQLEALVVRLADDSMHFEEVSRK